MAEINELKLDSPTTVEELIIGTLKEMGRIYELGPTPNLKNGEANTFADGVDKQGLINTAEALECFFIPYFFVKGIREKFWKGELIKLDYIVKSIKYIVNDYTQDVKNIDGKYKLPGDPYMNFTYRGENPGEPSGINKNIDFLDSACFILSALLDAKAINYEKEILIKKGIIKATDNTIDIIPPSLNEMVDKRIFECAMLIKECDLGFGKGWAFTYHDENFEPKREDQLYFTWNALETLELIKIYLEDAPHLIPDEIRKDPYYSKLDLKFADKLSYLNSTFLSGDIKTLDISQKAAIYFVGEDNNPNLYYNLFALISLMITQSDNFEKLNAAIGTITNHLKAEDFYTDFLSGLIYGKFRISGTLKDKHKKSWNERAFICLFLKAIARYHKKYPIELKNAIQSVSAYHDKSSEELIRDCFTLLCKARFNNYVWDNQRNQYTIYYTERAIEALVRVYEALFYDEKVEVYYKEEITPPEKEVKKISSTDPIIKIDLSEAIQNSIKEIINAKVKEILADEKIVGKIAEQIKESIIKNVVIDEISSDKTIMPFFQYFSLYLKNVRKGESEVDDNYKALKLFFTEIVGEIFIESFAHSLNIVGEKKKEKVEKDFSERLEAGLLYILDWENDPQQGVIDFGKTINKLRSEKFLEFIQKKTDKKK